jgi:hypothetical protein
MNKNMRLLVLLAATISLLLLGACDLFAPRKAEDPETPTPWNTFFINSSLTVQNLVFSYDYPQNALKYGDILSSNFAFHFAIQDVNDFGTPVSWNAESEQEMLVNLHRNLSNKDEAMQLELNTIPAQPDQVTATNAWIYRSYVISINSHSQEIPFYRGRCAIYLESDNGFWKIKDWFDYRTESNTEPNHSWGQLKYYQDNQDV